MRTSLKPLQASFDVLVIGGGISGCCIAHDAALRGLSVALVERGDFGAATSAASSRIIHGGIRYLPLGRVDKVRESAAERARFHAIAPHLLEDVPFLIPASGRGEAVVLRAGVAAYEACCAGIPSAARRGRRSRWQPRGEVLAQVPGLDPARVTGGQTIFESHMYSAERMTLAFVTSAVRHGAVAANYARVMRLLRRDRTVYGATVRDDITGDTVDVQARIIVNASGPWTSDVAGTGGRDRLQWRFKGVHILTRQLMPELALALPSAHRARTLVSSRERRLFVIPWRGVSLIGTTNDVCPDQPIDVVPTEGDIESLIADIRAAWPGCEVDRDDVLHATAGRFPVPMSASDDVYHVSGDYQVVDHEREDGTTGLVSALGMKFTTARALAERAVDLVERKLGRRPSPCRTGSVPLSGGDIADINGLRAALARELPAKIAPATIAHLSRAYGSDAARVAGTRAAGLEPHRPLSPAAPMIEAEVAFAVREEMAVRLDDVVLRRTGLGAAGDPGDAAVRRVADIMSGLLGWSPSRRVEEIARTGRAWPIRRPVAATA